MGYGAGPVGGRPHGVGACRAGNRRKNEALISRAGDAKSHFEVDCQFPFQLIARLRVWIVVLKGRHHPRDCRVEGLKVSFAGHSASSCPPNMKNDIRLTMDLACNPASDNVQRRLPPRDMSKRPCRSIVRTHQILWIKADLESHSGQWTGENGPLRPVTVGSIAHNRCSARDAAVWHS